MTTPRVRGGSGNGSGPRVSGHRWEAFARSVIDYYGGVCHICGCGGAKQPDHLEPVTERPELAFDLSNCRPAHGAPGNPCPQCSAAAGRKIHCNQIRGSMSVTRARRIITEMIAGHAGKRKKPAVPAGGTAGRVW
jgi:hypothetical protein